MKKGSHYTAQKIFQMESRTALPQNLHRKIFRKRSMSASSHRTNDDGCLALSLWLVC
jgi:hypothetical protein